MICPSVPSRHDTNSIKTLHPSCAYTYNSVNNVNSISSLHLWWYFLFDCIGICAPIFMHFYMLMYFWIIVIVSIIMTEARGRVTCICEPSLTIYCRPALLATILVVLQEYSMRIYICVLQIVRVYDHDHVLMYFTPCTILYIHRQPGWHICHIILEVLSTSYWAGQIGPEKTRPDCPIPNIAPLQCTSPS